jgi:two-component SAPR family response regulator
MSVYNRILVLPKTVCKAIYILIMLLPALQGSAQGLQFNSNDSLLSKRTSYVVFANDKPTFNNHLLISFDLSLWDNDHLGYVFNITDTSGNSYSLTYIFNHNGSPTLNFNIDSKSNKIEIPLNLTQLKKRKWIRVKADINLEANTVSFLVNDKWYKAKDFGFKGKITPELTFGKNKHYSDVPNMAIKNLTINDDSKKYYFPLNEWNGHSVHTDDGDAVGYVDHPAWLINESYFWTPKFKRTFNEVAGVNFDVNQQVLFMFKKDSLIQYNVQGDNVVNKPYNNKIPMTLLLGKSIVNTRQNKCYVYEVQPPDSLHSIAALDLSTLKWEAVGKALIKQQRHHHNIFFDKDQSNFYLFGGYGSFSYHKDFFKYQQATDSWENVLFTGDTISPRFFSGSSQADENNEVYIFGGYGNQSGNQIIGGKHFYDLYRINLTTRVIKKCWEISPDEEPFVSANNLIISKDKKFFYALCYPHEKPKTNLRLYKFSVKDGSYEIVSGTIPVASERIESDFNLFFDPKQDEFFCATQEFTSPSQSTVKIYALTSPPVSQQAYLSSQQTNTNRFSSTYKYLIALIIVICGALWYYIKRRELKDSIIKVDDEIIPDFYNKKKEADIKPNAVYLLGEFIVFNKNSKDITYLFSPKIKQLFILILLNSKDAHGVVSKKISTILWPDKEVVKTKNIKGVTINHLRSIIADIDGIELSFLNDTYCFKLSDSFFCDYFLITDAINQIHDHHITAEQFITDQFDLFARGGLLQYVPETWLDDVKLSFEELLMPVILSEIKKIYDGGDYKKALDVCRVALNIDPFNDISLKYKLKSLRRIKGIDYAKKVYDEFVTEYQKSMGSEYSVHFDKICR